MYFILEIVASSSATPPFQALLFASVTRIVIRKALKQAPLVSVTFPTEAIPQSMGMTPQGYLPEQQAGHAGTTTYQRPPKLQFPGGVGSELQQGHDHVTR